MDVSDQTPIFTNETKMLISECWKCNITLTRGGMYWKLRPPRTERFAEVLILHPEAREIARGRSPRAISRAEGCKINAEANLEVRGGRNFQWIPTLVSVITFFFPRRGCLLHVLGRVMKITRPRTCNGNYTPRDLYCTP